MGAGLVAVGIVIGFGGQIFLGREDSGPDSKSEMSGCATSDSVFLPATAYGKFVEVVDTRFQSLGFRGPPDRPEPHPGFEGGRGKGFFTAVALEPRYREENEAYARSQGYQPRSDRPVLPLSGSIVTEHPGLLEVYQTVSAFASEEGAARWINTQRSVTILNNDYVFDEPQNPLGDEMFLKTREPQNTQYERTISTSVRWGKVVVGFSFQGGANLNSVDVLPYMQNALTRIQAACGGDAG